MASLASATLLTNTILAPLLLKFRPTLSLPLLPTTAICTKFHTTRTVSITVNCTNSTSSSTLSWSSETDQESSEEDYDDEYTEDEGGDEGDASEERKMGIQSPPMRTRRRRYRKMYPGEKEGITEEMRFVAMKLRNSGKPKKPKSKNKSVENDEEMGKSDEEIDGLDSLAKEKDENGESWEPSVQGFLKYLVDSRHVFSTIERIVDESSDVSYVYFRKTGLERADCISLDLEWFSQQGNSIPKPSNPGITYAKYLEEIAEKNPALFMCHFYNVYFSHIAGGQVIAKKVSKKILDERELEFFKWEGNEEELLRAVRENLNMLAEHWSRDQKTKCLRESTKAFRFLGQIVRLIIL